MRKITVAGVKRRLGRYRLQLGRRIGGTTPDRAPEPFAAGFHSWLWRRAGSTFVGFPADWRLEHPRPAQPAPIAVLMHVYFPELVDELLGELAAIPMDFDLIVTNASGQSLDIAVERLAHLRHVTVLEVQNHGRDIWPMVQVVNAGYLDAYPIVLKVHTKKSEWRSEHSLLEGSGDQWKQGFFDALLGSEENVTSILNAFVADPDLGVVTSDGSLLGADFWGGDLPIVESLLKRLRLPIDPAKLEFPAGSFYWIRGFALTGLRSLCLTAEDFESEAGQVDATTAHAIERLVGILSTEAGFRLAERSGLLDLPVVANELDAPALARELANPTPRARPVAFYLPQFHTFEENNAWWGEGFTEWANVAKAVANFDGHNQPLLPADLGFYDLNRDEVRKAQTELAAAHGLQGFMYYYYWFGGKRLMDMPIERLAQSELDQPFCLMWANENWTRRWDGRDSEMLIAQNYDEVPAELFIDDIAHLLADPRYMRVDGQLVLAVYRLAQIPGYEAVLQHWRDRARELGLGELRILAVDVGEAFDGLRGDYESAGVQGSLAFAPHNLHYDWLPHEGLGIDPRFRGNILSYQGMVRDYERRLLDDFPERDFPGCMVNFDNTARRQWNPDLWLGTNPYTFRRWLALCVRAVVDREPDERLVFINAWNEWAESAVLEPTERWGRTYLHAVRSAVLR